MILKSSKDYFLVLDIGTSFIKSLIFQKEKERKIILANSLESLENFQITEGIFREKLKKSIEKAISEILKKVKIEKKIEGVFLNLPANILKSKVSIENFKRENPEIEIKKREKEEIEKKVFSLSQKKVLERLNQQFGILIQDFEIIETKISEIKIDGYLVSELTDFSGQNLEFQIFQSFLPRNYFEIINRIFEDLGFKILKIGQFLEKLATFLLEKKPEGIFLDIGGETTQIILFKEGKIREILDFALGGENFSQALAKTLGMGKDEVRELKIRYSQGLLSREVKEKIQEILLPVKINWFQELKLKLKEVFGPIPSNFYLYGGGSQIPEIEEILINGDWENLLIFQPEIKTLWPKDFKKIEGTEKINNPQYIPSLLIVNAI